MKSLAAALIVVVALWPAVIAGTAIADPGVSADPTSTPVPTPTPTPSPSPGGWPPQAPPGSSFDFNSPFPPQLTATPGSPVAAGTATILAATVSWQIGPLTTTGGVTFTDGDTTLGTVPVTVSSTTPGTATIIVTLPPGDHQIVAIFTGLCPSGETNGVSWGCIGNSSASSPLDYIVEAQPTPTPTVTPTPKPTLPVFAGFFHQLIARLLGQLHFPLLPYPR